MKWLRSRPLDVNELDECRIWAQNQETMTSQADLGDSEMIDGNDEVDEGEVEDEDMDPPADENDEVAEQENYDVDNTNTNTQIRDVTQQQQHQQRKKKSSRRRNHDALLNGNAGGTVVSVGDVGG